MPGEAVEPVIRLATVKDIDVLASLRIRLLRESCCLSPETDRDALEEAIRTYLRGRIPAGEFIAWVAEAGGEIVATSGLVFWHKPPLTPEPSGGEAYIMNMYTVPEWRGRGLARALFERILEHVTRSGIKRLTLHATEAGASIYARYGFRHTTSEMALDLP